MANDETTRLLRPGSDVETGGRKDASHCSHTNGILFGILFTGFLVSLTNGLTQVPIIYLFRQMTCDAFYTTRSPYSGPGDRCSRIEIDSAAAIQISILGISSSVCGIMNLLLCGTLIKRFGLAWALFSQTSFLALRVTFQAIAVSVGGRDGMILLQTSQLIGIIGGPRGYLLILNIAVSQVTEKKEHTSVFGRLQGAVMMGTAIGYLLGGIFGDVLGIRSPFITSVGCYVISSVYSPLYMPQSGPEAEHSGVNKGLSGGIFAPFGVLMPQQFRLRSGKIVQHYGLAILALGIFFGVLATSYAPMLLQQYATSQFNFGTTENGLLMFGNSSVRGIFLIFIFPKIITAGRAWFASIHPVSFDPKRPSLIDNDPLPSIQDEMDPVPGLILSENLGQSRECNEEDDDSTFDLSFLRWSLIIDGIVTSSCAWATEGWHLYLVAFLLPFASGSAPAAKGVITEMCPVHLRQDALSAITLVESAATLTTQGVFGLIYSTLSAAGKANLTFFCNGGLAIVSVAILLLAHYPPLNSKRVCVDKSDETVE